MESVGSIVMYGIIVAAIIVFSILTVTTRRILRAATYLLFVLFATAGLYFKLDYEFLGAVQIAVYAGGIVVQLQKAADTDTFRFRAKSRQDGSSSYRE